MRSNLITYRVFLWAQCTPFRKLKEMIEGLFSIWAGKRSTTSLAINTWRKTQLMATKHFHYLSVLFTLYYHPPCCNVLQGFLNVVIFSSKGTVVFRKSFIWLRFCGYVFKFEVCLLFCYVSFSGRRSLEVRKRRKVNSYEIYILFLRCLSALKSWTCTLFLNRGIS